MDLQAFAKNPSGWLAPTVEGHFGFVPNPLPPQLDLTALDRRLTEAGAAIGELRGVGRNHPNPYLLASPLQRSEALASSRMEGTVSSLEDLVLAEAMTNDVTDLDALEVRNYSDALRHGIKRVDEIPLSTRLILELHGILMRDLPVSRTGGRAPAQYRTEQNMIGVLGPRSVKNARFVPPPPPLHIDAMKDLENFVNSATADRMSPLVVMALAHYQFETIHPFPDGNGRVGRILLTVLSKTTRIMTAPLFFLSPSIEDAKG